MFHPSYPGAIDLIVGASDASRQGGQASGVVQGGVARGRDGSAPGSRQREGYAEPPDFHAIIADAMKASSNRK
ncbi:MAG: hypothetical protein HQL53_06145 [Magnetococcales bacterium]|nr:hypothetical protein [Magnetococcales bacterium]